MFDSLINWVPKDWQPVMKHSLAVAAILVVALVVYWVIRRAIRLARQRGAIPEPVEVVSLFFVRYVLAVVVLLLVLQSLGVLAGAWGMISAVLAMVAIGFFAVWSVLSNLMCTLFLLVARPFRVGDTVELMPEGLAGKVVDLSFTYTTLSSDDGGLLRVPNNLFLQRMLRIRRGERRLDLADQLVRDQPFK